MYEAATGESIDSREGRTLAARLHRYCMSKLRRAGLEILAFFSNKVFFRNLVLLLGVLLIGFLILYFGLRMYTGHGESSATPDLTGLTIEQAEKLLKGKSFEYKVVDSSYYFPDKPPLYILSQSPEAKMQVKSNRTIYLTVNKVIPTEVTLPRDMIWGIDLKLSERILKQKGIYVKIKDEVFDMANTEGQILEVFYNSKKLSKDKSIQLPKGATLNVIVSKGRGNAVAIPALVGKTVDEATFILENKSLNVFLVGSDQVTSVTDTANCYIYRQEPSYDPFIQAFMGDQFILFFTPDRVVNSDDLNLEGGQSGFDSSPQY